MHVVSSRCAATVARIVEGAFDVAGSDDDANGDVCATNATDVADYDDDVDVTIDYGDDGDD
jgi:hypothetical protein